MIKNYFVNETDIFALADCLTNIDTPGDIVLIYHITSFELGNINLPMTFIYTFQAFSIDILRNLFRFLAQGAFITVCVGKSSDSTGTNQTRSAGRYLRFIYCHCSASPLQTIYLGS